MLSHSFNILLGRYLSGEGEVAKSIFKKLVIIRMETSGRKGSLKIKRVYPNIDLISSFFTFLPHYVY
jgi:hypothetical protein